MAITKMKFVSATSDYEHLDSMLMSGINSNMLHVEEAANIINEDNHGKLLDEENVWSTYEQTIKNFAYNLNYELKKKDKNNTYTTDEVEAFIKESSEKFGISADSEKVILTKDDEAALAALSECNFEKMHACQYLCFLFGRLPKESFKKLSMYQDENFVHHKLHENEQYVWMVIVTSDSYKPLVDKIFKDLFFEEMSIPTVDIQKLLRENSDKIDDIYTFVANKSEIHEKYEYVANIDDKYVLSGFVKESDVEKYQSLFDKSVTFEVKDPSEVPELNCPTLLKNNWFARPFELFIEMYGVPKYGEFDPTGFVALTYCLLFGIMFGDLGQGFVLFVLGLALEKKKGKLFGIMGRIGITSMIFGFLFGSVFGNEELLNPIHQALFGVDEKLFEVMANSSTMVLLIGAIVIGAILILVTQLMNIVLRLRKKEVGEALFSQNGVAGLLFYGSIIVAIACIFVLKVNVINPLYIGICFILPIICFVFKEPLCKVVEGKSAKPEEGWGGYIVQSVFELLEVLLTFVTNSMSYLRVGGFVLSHAGMMLVVMTLVKMTGNAGPLVMVFGNIFVMLLEGLIVGIQTLRLEYYEMFSRYYEAGGIPFKILTSEEN